MSRSFITNAEGNFFYQAKREEKFKWLTCTGVGDIDMPEGDPTPQYCPDPLESGKFKIEGFTQGVAGASTYSITKPLVSAWNFILGMKCAFTGRINWVCRGIRQDPRNYEVALLMLDSTPSRRGITAPVSFDGTEARVNTNMDLSFYPYLDIYRLSIIRQTVVNTSNVLSIYFLPERCEDRCGPARGLCEVGIAGLVGPGVYFYESEIKKTFDGGDSWAATPTDPYTWGGDTGAVWMLDTLDGVRYLTFRTEPVAGIPAEVGISDDYGVTWTNVLIGNVPSQSVIAVTMRGGDLVVVCNDGYIYSSSDQGETWDEREDGTESGGAAFNGICYYGDNIGYAVGDGPNIVYTTTGLTGWASVAAPGVGFDIVGVAVNDKGNLFVVTDDGRMFRTEDISDAGAWEEWVDHNGGSIDWIGFDPKAAYVGYYLYNDAAGRGWLYRSEDGGASWAEVRGMPDNDGLNAAHICDQNHVAIVGNMVAADGTSFFAMTVIAV